MEVIFLSYHRKEYNRFFLLENDAASTSKIKT